MVFSACHLEAWDKALENFLNADRPAPRYRAKLPHASISLKIQAVY